MATRFLLILCVAGCTAAPQIDGAPRTGRAADAPDLVPVQSILSQASPVQARAAPQTALQARLAALHARARRLRAR